MPSVSMAEHTEASANAAASEHDDARGVGKQPDLRAMLVVIALAAGFALVPRVTRGCEGASLDEPAPDFDARVVANADKLGLGDPTGAPLAAGQRLALSSLRGRPVILD